MARGITTALGPVCWFFFLVTPDLLASQVDAANILPFEAAYIAAPLILSASIRDFHPDEGATVEVLEVVKGHVTGKRLVLQGTSNFPFLDAPGTPVVVFAVLVTSGVAELWQGPTSGGLIWNTPDLLDDIATAAADPETAIHSSSPRRQLAAAYFIAHRDSPAPNRDNVVRTLIWGLDHTSAETNATAYNGLTALGLDLDEFGPYHPGHNMAHKQAFTQRLRERFGSHR